MSDEPEFLPVRPQDILWGTTPLSPKLAARLTELPPPTPAEANSMLWGNAKDIALNVVLPALACAVGLTLMLWGFAQMVAHSH